MYIVTSEMQSNQIKSIHTGMKLHAVACYFHHSQLKCRIKSAQMVLEERVESGKVCRYCTRK